MGTIAKTAKSPNYKIRAWAHGDSITDLTGASGVNTIPSWTVRIGSTKRIHNRAHSAWRLDHMNEDLWSGLGNGPNGSSNSIAWGPTPEQLFCLGGINDLNVGGTGGTNLSNMQTRVTTMASKAGALGITLYLITLLPFPENNTGWWSLESGRLAHNTFLRSTYNDASLGGTHPVFYIDAESWMGGVDKSGSGGPSNCRPAAYSFDHVHNSAAGQERLALLVDQYVLPEL